MKTILTIAALLWAHTILAADVSPGLPLGRPLQNGDSITAAVLNGSLNGTINGTFYTSKAIQPNPSAANDIILMWNNSSGIFEYTTYGQLLVNTNLIAARTPYTSGLSNTFSLLVLDNAGQALGQTTVSNLFYYGGIIGGGTQFTMDASGNIVLKSGSGITNAALNNPTLTNNLIVGPVITNGSSSNTFTINGNSALATGLRFFNSSDNAGSRSYDIHTSGNQMVFQLWDDTFTTAQTWLSVNRQNGTSNVTSIAMTASSNAVGSQVFLVPAGFQIGASGTPVAQVNTFDSGTNNAIPATSNKRSFALSGFGGAPTSYRIALVCCATEMGYSVGDEVEVTGAGNAGGNATGTFTSFISSSTIDLQRRSANGISITPKGGGVMAEITEAKWSLHCYATYIH